MCTYFSTKEESTIIITFTEKERKEYEKIEQKAKEMYDRIKRRDPTSISRNYIKISSALLPLRLACSGGDMDGSDAKKIERNSGKSTKTIDITLDDSEMECPICLDHIENARATLCKPVAHIFCKDCIAGCFDGGQSIPCPSCRATIKVDDLCSVNVVDPMEGKEDACAPEPAKKTRRKGTIEDLMFKSKFKRLVVELKRIQDNEPQSKSLVFSQFASTLQWMKQELPKHGFQFRTLSGDMQMKKRAEALRQFQQDPPTTIFLLSMRSGAVGINLTQANRVFLMEPAMNPALEAQAVGRVYRLGQRKSVQVIRMRIENSIETRMVEMLSKKYGAAKKLSSDEANAASIATSSSTAIMPAVGHMFRDKATFLEQEFNLLFGV
jgi:SWI/SNF-related matrix-associated actin-dependent regulator of chromatin subfamily A3